MLRDRFHLVLSTMFGLLLVGAIANGQSDTQAINATQISDRDDLTIAAEAILKALSGTELDKGFEAMTPQGADQFTATILWEAASAAIIRPEPGTALPEGTKELKAVGLKYGLGKVKNPMPDLFALISKSPEEQVKYLTEHMEKTQLSLLAAVKPEQRREAVKEISDTLLKANRPDPKLALGQSKIFGNRAELTINGTVPDETGESTKVSPVMYLVFVKVDGRWLFDEIDYEKLFNTINATATQAEEFKPIENIQIAGEASDGRKVSLADSEGKVVLIDFWGTWCGPCLASLPELTTLHEEFHNQGLDILGIAADDAETLNNYLSDNPLQWTNIVDGEGSIASSYGIAAYPTTLLIDKNGTHVATNLHGETLRKAIELLLADKSIQSVTGKAAEVLDAGLRRAASEKKLVFLHVGSSELGPCKQLARWISLPEIKGKLENVFVDVSIDMAVNAGAEELVTSISPNSSGFPWFAFLDPAQDQPVATCEAASMGNIGFPQATEGIAHFVKMFEATGRFTVDELGLLRKSLEDAVQQGLNQQEEE